MAELLTDDELEQYAAKPKELAKYAAKPASAASTSDDEWEYHPAKEWDENGKPIEAAKEWDEHGNPIPTDEWEYKPAAHKTEQQRLGVKTPASIPPMKAQAETEFEKQNKMDPFGREATEFGLGAASGASGLPESEHPLSDFPKTLNQKPSTADILGQSILGPAYGVGKSLYETGKEIFSPTGAHEDPEDAAMRRAHGVGTGVGMVAPLALGESVERGDLPQKLGNVKDTLGLRLRTEKGGLGPKTKAVSRFVGAGLGHLTGIPGMGEVGGFIMGPSLADAILPKRPFDIPVKNELGAPFPLADEFYAERGRELEAIRKQKNVLDRAAAKPDKSPFGNPKDVPYGGVVRLPEPNAAVSPINPKYMASVPRESLLDMAESRTPGAATQLQQLGAKPVYMPETGYAAPKSITEFPGESEPVAANEGLTHTPSEKAETMSAPRKIVPEQEAQNWQEEADRNRNILRDERATPEDKRVAQSRLDEMEEVKSGTSITEPEEEAEPAEIRGITEPIKPKAAPREKPIPVERKYSPEEIIDAEGLIQQEIGMMQSADRPGSYFDEWEQGNAPIKQNLSSKQGERAGGKWRGVKSGRNMQPFMSANPDLNPAALQKALRNKDSAMYRKAIDRAVDFIRREASRRAQVSQNWRPQ